MHALDYASEAKDIFVLPDAVLQIKRLIDDHATDMEDIAAVINFDPALTVQILKIANSALYKFPKKVDSIAKAIQVIGTNSVYDLVVACSICKTFEEINRDVVDLERYWENAVYCGLLSKYFAEKLGIRESERLFVSGLLHNVGELVMIRFNPDLAQKCSMINESETPVMLQQRYLGATYAEIGATLVKMWGIPKEIYQPINNQHYSIKQPQSLDDKVIQLSYVMALDSCNPEIYSGHANLEVEMYEGLNFDDSELNIALNHVGMQSLSVLAMFSPSSTAVL